MKSRSVEIILVSFSAFLLAWGLIRAYNRGDTIVYSPMTFVMTGLIATAAVNIAIRSRLIALAVIGLCVFFLVAFIAAETSPSVDRPPVTPLLIARSVGFLGMVGLTGWMQFSKKQHQNAD